MTFFLENILFPCLAFVVLSVWVLRRRPQAAPPRRGRFTALMAAGFVGLSAATWGLLSGLRPGDGWGGMPALVFALCTGAGALRCLAGLVFGLLSGVVSGGAADDGGSHAEAARARAQARRAQRRAAPAPPPEP